MYKSKIGGILSIVSGGIGIFTSLMWLAMTILMSNFMMGLQKGMPYQPYQPDFEATFNMIMTIYLVMAAGAFIMSILAIVGGVFALKRKNWKLCLAGSIASIIAFLACGIASIIFIIQAKDEFQTTQSDVNAMTN